MSMSCVQEMERLCPRRQVSADGAARIVAQVCIMSMSISIVVYRYLYVYLYLYCCLSRLSLRYGACRAERGAERGWCDVEWRWWGVFSCAHTALVLTHALAPRAVCASSCCVCLLLLCVPPLPLAARLSINRLSLSLSRDCV